MQFQITSTFKKNYKKKGGPKEDRLYVRMNVN